MDEFSELEHIRNSNRGDSSQNTSPEQPGRLKYYYGLSVFRENLNLSNIWYDYDPFYFGTHISKFLHKYQIFLKEFDENSWKLDVNIRLLGNSSNRRNLDFLIFGFRISNHFVELLEQNVYLRM